MTKTCVYIDGFNLYYGSLRKTPYRWLDLEQLCRLMLRPNDVQRINYYTARVGARLDDPEQPICQQAYLRALGTLPTVRVHFGHYLSHPVWRPLERSVPGGLRFARVRAVPSRRRRPAPRARSRIQHGRLQAVG